MSKRVYVFHGEDGPDLCPINDLSLNPSGLRDNSEDAPCTQCPYAHKTGSGGVLRYGGQNVFVECLYDEHLAAEQQFALGSGQVNSGGDEEPEPAAAEEPTGELAQEIAAQVAERDVPEPEPVEEPNVTVPTSATLPSLAAAVAEYEAEHPAISGEIEEVYQAMVGRGFEITRGDVRAVIEQRQEAEARGHINCPRCGAVAVCPYKDNPGVDRPCLGLPR